MSHEEMQARGCVNSGHDPERTFPSYRKNRIRSHRHRVALEQGVSDYHVMTVYDPAKPDVLEFRILTDDKIPTPHNTGNTTHNRQHFQHQPITQPEGGTSGRKASTDPDRGSDDYNPFYHWEGKSYRGRVRWT